VIRPGGGQVKRDLKNADRLSFFEVEKAKWKFAGLVFLRSRLCYTPAHLAVPKQLSGFISPG
jgi:hypothetical protein